MLTSFYKRILWLIVIVAGLQACHYDQNNTLQGSSAPEITEKKPDGTSLSLSSLKGNIVLVDFWASWCRPCREKNPDIVKLYSQYHNKKFKNGGDFEIFSVSLDSRKENWLYAIQEDHLSWPNHVCDFKGWKNDAAINYNVHQIPYSYLLDEKGTIICVDCSISRIKEELNKRQTDD